MNMDDLGDYRPGLKATVDHGLWHPCIEGGFAKQDFPALACALGLGQVAELPATACLCHG